MVEYEILTFIQNILITRFVSFPINVESGVMIIIPVFFDHRMGGHHNVIKSIEGGFLKTRAKF